MKVKYSTKKQKNKEDFENDHKVKEKQEAYLVAPRIFKEIKQINSEIDDLEKELERTFKFYNHKNQKLY